ncbi:MAG: glucose 1-dehydrogenase [Pirellulales bacterium]|nr:glucose 1-dehydrogenase [Pirellulales bacterium]
MFRLDGKTALVTGSATGLGAATAIRLAEAGADVIVSDRPEVDTRPTVEQAQRHGRHVASIAIDVRQLDAIAQGVETAEREFGRIDVLVNNAGVNRPAAGADVTEEDWDLQFQVNVKGAFFMAQAVARSMRRRGQGRIVFMASQSGLVGIPGQPAYCATKGAVILLTRTLGVEWAQDGITVNAVAPTFVETALMRDRLQNEDYRQRIMRKLPGGRLATPDDVAAAVVFLASDEAIMVNAAVLTVDGGWTAW